MHTAWQVYAHRLRVMRVCRALAAWRAIARRGRRLAWAQRVWRRRALEAAFAEWHVAVAAARWGRRPWGTVRMLLLLHNNCRRLESPVWC